MAAYESLLDAVGRTPLVRLHGVTAGLAPAVYAKLEYLNPGGSVKDRAGRWMVLDAVRTGALRPGGTIVEGTSGNTGIGLAQAAAQLGFPLVVVVPDKTSVEKIDTLRAYGAEVVVTASGLPRQHPDSVPTLARRIADERPGGWLANQYDNPANPQAHRESTGPEIWADTQGRVTHLVAGVGTGGTITGTGEFLKGASGGRVQVVGADPIGSTYSGGDGAPFFVEAAGHYLHPQTTDDVWPESFTPSVVDRYERIPDRESVDALRALARADGILVGGSSGLALAAGLRVAATLGPDDVVVVLLPDSGRAYLSKYHSEQWRRRFGFQDDDADGSLVLDAVGALALPVGAQVPVLPADLDIGAAAVAVHALADDHPVLVVLPRAQREIEPPVSEVLGLVRPRTLRSAGPALRTVADVAGPVPATVGTGERTATLAAEPADEPLVVLRDGRVHAVTTRGVLAAAGQPVAEPVGYAVR